MISAVLLAAGESRRMGEFKQLLPFGDKTFVDFSGASSARHSAGRRLVPSCTAESEIAVACLWIGETPVR